VNKSKIEYCDYTWNPVTGCYHGCEYCYAEKIAKRFGDGSGLLTMERVNHLELYTKPGNPYPDYFAPTFHRYRLDELQKVKKPSTIFVCSMADLFGDWVPDEWIQAVLKACGRAPQHRYLFLTKNPKKYKSIYQVRMDTDLYLATSWFGATITNIEQLYEAASYGYVEWLSLEPLQEDISKELGEWVSDWHPHERPQWIVIGAETGNRKGRITVEKQWIQNIANICRRFDIPLFMKDSLAPIWGKPLIQQLPWDWRVAEP